ncbi:glucose-methanol-choline oxidoreductase [Caballeronia pedi]|uniref:Glucose-methanol-choline oxidoreductase n=1 Tax=Caballeronia pedi TaxID=1777141 RepID=A0A158DZB1_9BURK|nr:glucose-methanol-choline oxidoreductase [Caballeronia pedi]
MSDDPQHVPCGKHRRAPDVFRQGSWLPMREYEESDAVDFAIVGTGAGDGTLACRLAEKGFRVVAFDAGAWWRPLEEFASDEMHQSKLFWTDERICGGENPLKLGNNNSGKAVGGSTVHFAMVSLRFRPKWFKSRSVLGYGADWPLGWHEMWRYYAEVENALKISGPVKYPWGPKRPRYPYRPHELNAAALVLARGCEALGIDWTPTPLAIVSAPRGEAHPCVYRGFCVSGCATNAKQSALVNGYREPCVPARRFAISQWSGASSWATMAAQPASNTSAKDDGAFSAAQCGRRGLCDRDAATLVDVRDGSLSRRPREQLGPRRKESDGAVESGRVGHHGRGSELVQGAAFAFDDRALELPGHGQGFLRRLYKQVLSWWRNVEASRVNRPSLTCVAYGQRRMPLD